MQNNLLNRILIGTLLSSTLIAFTIHAENQVIEKIHKQITLELSKHQESDLCDSFQKHAHALEVLLVCCLNQNNDEGLTKRIKKMRAVIDLFEQHILNHLDQKIPQTIDVSKKQSLITVRTLVHEVLLDLRAICKIFDEYDKSTDLLSLTLLGNKLGKYKHRLPKTMRGWTVGQWKKIIEHLARCPDID